jgi:hypothetical protein
MVLRQTFPGVLLTTTEEAGDAGHDGVAVGLSMKHLQGDEEESTRSRRRGEDRLRRQRAREGRGRPASGADGQQLVGRWAV